MHDRMDEVFRALASPARRRLLDRLHEENGATQQALCGGLEMSQQAVAQHLSVLEKAGLVTSVRRGREKLHYLNPLPLQAIADRWIHKFERDRVQLLGELKRKLEEEP